MSANQWADLSITDNAEFYVSLCKHGDHVHNFLSLGVVGQDGHAYTLMNVGFSAGGYAATCYESLCGPRAGLHEERGVTYHEEAYTYKAYTISRQEYLDFVDQVRIELKSKKARAYVPIESGGNVFRYIDTNDSQEKFRQVNPLNNPRVNAKFSLRNTCRQVAQSTAKAYFNIEYWGRGVYRKFFIPLPYAAETEQIEIGLNALNQSTYHYRSKQALYVFPRPPKKGEMHYQQRRTIMRRMEIIAKDNSPLSRQKFAAWKALYVTLSPAQAQRTPEELLSELKEWMSSHQGLMTKHRKERRHQWFSTKSEKLVKQLQEEFQVPSIPGCQ